MSTHKLEAGKSFIENLKFLADILNYHVKLELPVGGSSKSNAVDVAWFKDEKHKFPLFIFEVESSISNGAAYNPLKVFSKQNDKFEKPLFFFQVFVGKGKSPSKITDLKAQFGAFNYRTYRLSKKEGQLFLFDILSQHCRISSQLNISKLFYFLLESKWLDIDFQRLASHIEELDFERDSGNILASYVHLSSLESKFLPITYNYLRKIHSDYYSNSIIIDYKTYIGDTWHFPIHQGIIYALSSDFYIKNKAFQELKVWQENSQFLSKIGPHFGLSRDYDDFIIWDSGGLFALLSSLFNDNVKIKMYLVDELRKIIDATVQEYKLPNLLWLIHILPRTAEGDKIFINYVVKQLKKVKAFSAEYFLAPPFLGADNFINIFLSSREPLSNIPLLKQHICQKQIKHRINAVQVACEVLTTDSYQGINTKIVMSLY